MNTRIAKYIKELCDEGWYDPSSTERNEIVFVSRLREYGAYEIRKHYKTRVILSLAIAVSLVVLAFSGPMLIRTILKSKSDGMKLLTEEIILAEPPPIDKSQPPPPPLVVPPPLRETIKFTPPKVVKDDVADEPPPTQDETKDVVVSTVNREGEKGVELPPDNPIVTDPDEGKVFTYVEEMPSFPGGEEKLMEYLKQSLQYPVNARENAIEGRVSVSFVVDKTGKVKNAKLLRGIGGGCDEEAMRVVNGMPDWKAGKQNGRYVSVANIVVYADFRLK